MNLVEGAHDAGRAAAQAISRTEQKALGQFMTPPAIARHMALSLVARASMDNCVRVLEPAAGAGVLAAAVVEAILRRTDRPARIELLMWEIDPRLHPNLQKLAKEMRVAAEAAGVRFEAKIYGEDFLLSRLALWGQSIEHLLVISNPPFFKLAGDDPRAKAHSYAVWGQPNIYGIFMAACARLVGRGGGWCFITPRSWMSGAYFTATRRTILRYLSIEQLHEFVSRTEGFEDDAVLQETVIAWATPRPAVESGGRILLTRSHGMADLDSAAVQALPFERVVGGDEHAMLSLPHAVDEFSTGWTATLADHGLQVSTGPVVAFRAAEHLRSAAEEGTVPLLWMQHIKQQRVLWPINKKREFIRASAANAWMLVPNLPMVLMRRFSPKEDERRCTAAAYVGELPGATLGLENHLNYIYRPGGMMSRDEVQGLAALLSSRAVDAHFRALAGTTQVNATELRKLPLPPMSVICRIGRALPAVPTLVEIDAVVERELGLEQEHDEARAASA
jgi:adenine-specific DNA-methyltransferase